MDRRRFVGAGALLGATVGSGRAARGAAAMRPEVLIGEPEVVLGTSPDPQTVYSGTPGICQLPDGRLVATFEWRGAGVPGFVTGPFAGNASNGTQAQVLTSDDGGTTWTRRAGLPVVHSRPFVAGGRVYSLGHAGDLRIFRSDDRGETWSEPHSLTSGQRWHQSACSVIEHEGYVYLVMERNTDHDFRGWSVSVLAPVLMRAPVDADLTQRESWAFASELSFREAIARYGAPTGIGSPFYTPGRTAPDNPGDPRHMAPPGWLEANVVQIHDPDHLWYDPAGRTFHLYLRAHTGGVNLAALAKVTVQDDGAMVTDLERAPSGEPILFIPLPGGQMRFHICYDAVTRTYWLLSTQATDSMTRPERLGADRFNLPNNERHRLALHFSTNAMDWCFAGLVAVGATPRCARHYAGMCLAGDDICIVSRSGDERSKSAHDGNLATFHRVRDFRRLVY